MQLKESHIELLGSKGLKILSVNPRKLNSKPSLNALQDVIEDYEAKRTAKLTSFVEGSTLSGG